ncbi:protein O-mannosyl-transferase family [candidate division KSB1 bacterium]
MKKVLPFLLFFITVMILTLSSHPSIGWWDSGSYVLLSKYMSSPVPAGSILYILLGRFLDIFLFFTSTVNAVTMVSILSAVLASLMMYYTLLYIFRYFHEEENSGQYITAFLSALAFPFMFNIWQEAAVTRVYILGVFFTGVILYCTVRIWLTEDDETKERLFILLAFILGLDFAAHRLNTPFLPVMFLLLLFPLRHRSIDLKFLSFSLFSYIIGFSVHLFILIRSGQNTLLDMSAVNSFDDLMNWIFMDRYGQGSNFLSILDRRGPFWEYQIKEMYLRYVGWNFLGREGITLFKAFPFFLTVTGFFYSLIKKPKTWIVIAVTFLFYSFMLLLYLNVREGFQSIEREIARLYLPSFLILFVWTGIGLYFICNIFNWITERIKFHRNSAVVFAGIIGFCILPLNLFISNCNECDKSGYYFPVDFAYNILNSCEENAIIFSNGDNDTFPLWYSQYVEGIRPDVSVVNLSLLNLKYYAEQLVREPFSLPIDTAYINREGFFQPTRTDSVVPVKFALSDSFGEVTDSLELTIPGRRLGDNYALLAQDKMLLTILKENRWERPVYFTITTSRSNQPGLGGQLKLTGMAFRIVPDGDTDLSVKDLENKLLNVFRFRGFSDPNILVDQNTRTLFTNFRFLFLQLVNFYLSEGELERAGEIFDKMEEKLPRWRFSDNQNQMILQIEERLKRSEIY